MFEGAGKAQFLTEVFPAELEEIARRRRAAASGQPEPGPGPPQAARTLIGLALSGGGIRSATFGLGVVQALANRGFLKLVDYLSTVSGGGFIGSCLSATLNNPDSRAEGSRFPLRFEAGREEPAAVVHLRNSGNYLAPAGLLDKFRLAAIVLRGILLNLMLFLPYIMLAVVLTELGHELGRSVAGIFRFTPLVALGLFGALVVTFPLIGKLLWRRLSWRGRNAYERLIALALLLALTVLALVPVLLLIEEAIRLDSERVREWLAYEAGHAFEGDDPTHWLLLIVFLAGLTLVVTAARRATHLRGRIGLYLLGVLGPAALFAAYLAMSVFQIDSPYVRSRTVATFELDKAELFGDAQQLAPPLRRALESTSARLGPEPRFTAIESGQDPGCGLQCVEWRVFDETREQVLIVSSDQDEHHLRVTHDFEAELDRGWFSAGLRHEFASRGLAHSPAPQMEISGAAGDWRITDNGNRLGYRIRRHDDRLEFVDMATDLWDDEDQLFVLTGLALLLFSFLFVNVNQTSSHGFYRDRLSRAYLLRARELLFEVVLDVAAELDAGELPESLAAELAERGLEPRRPITVTALEPGRSWRIKDRRGRLFVALDGDRLEVSRAVRANDTLHLSELGRDGSAAPYHLINVALNLQGSDDPGVRGRQADFFVFSKRFSGGLRTGYCPTDKLEAVDHQLDLGTAMAISAAAAAPNMGATTIPSLVFVLTLLNIRLGYWLPNPGWVRSSSAWRRLVARGAVGPRHLLQEALGKVHDKGAFVNLSDGGHLENLGVYELIRRRCRWIVAVDAEGDPRHSFGGLVKLIRLARIDLGVDIKIDIDSLRRDEAGRSAGHFAVGTIHYGQPADGEIGHLIYLKASMTGDEDRDVLDYQARHPLFPHESTVDQFFTEDQFEAYRALGYHAADGMLAELERPEGDDRAWSELRKLMRPAG